MGLGTIPTNTNSCYIDTCATFSTLPGITYIIGFQVHTHGLGRRVSAYLGSASSIIRQEMCIFNLLVMNNVVGQFNGKNAFMKGTCTANQEALINQKEAIISKPFLPTIPALDTTAAYGNITDSKSYSGGPNGTLTINLGEETFTDSIG